MKKIDLTKGRIITVITALALPIMGSSLLQFTYNIIDMMWVGKLGSNAVASIGSSSLYINIGNAINSLVVIGTGIKTAHAIGRKDDNEVKEYINSGIIINIIIGVLFGLILIFGGKSFIGFLNLNNDEVERNAYSYLALNAPILFFAFFNMMYTRILGSFGNNKLAFKINSAGVILNIILDPIFIYVFKLGIIGAGLGTLVANVSMFTLFKINSNGILHYDFKKSINAEKIKEIIKLGSPMAFQRILFTVINIMLAKIIAMFGSDAIAAQKIGVQIGKYERIKKGYRSSLFIGITYALFIQAVFLFLNKYIINLFITDSATVEIAAAYLRAVAFSQVFSAVEMISNGLFTGIGKPNIPAAISIIFTSLRIPIALILIKPFGINGIWMSISITSIFKGIFSYMIWFIKSHRGKEGFVS